MNQSINLLSARTKTLKLAALLLLLCIELSGCRILAPRVTAIKQIHATYRDEFQSAIQLSIDKPNDKSALPKADPNRFVFTNTLKEIRDFQAKYPDNSSLNAHLNVLQGMIYLQSGEMGMAKSVQTAISDPNTIKLLKSKRDGFTRDQLFAQSFADLIKGWSEIQNQIKAEAGQQSNGANTQNLLSAADNIVALLGTDKFKDKESPDIDEGAIYLATVASTFYVWEIAINSGQPKDDKCTKYKNGRDQIKKYLSAQELKPSLEDITIQGGRYRYLSWYKFLDKQVRTLCPNP
ncbi:hypothetical protein [Spirosoma sp. 48-14]|uniref:hypothetical protein n=1 Tax=Spirosoma sp. 48-14 TaxID=1895854 RepID=UPI00095AF8F6|nr:hypothetical protein [Spirosoma sp. 48-14]OJW70508.1 MAG: hypothetical protein BGO59_25015 [Spirosoma sp. 48-14]